MTNFGNCKWCGNFLKTADISGHGDGICNNSTYTALGTAIGETPEYPKGNKFTERAGTRHHPKPTL